MIIITKLNKLKICIESFRKMSKTQVFNELSCFNLSKQIVPTLTTQKRKGQYGRIGVIGGSFEYTGAPYFVGISALKVGADLVHIFCTTDSAIAIKSYSPELIVHPLLDTLNAVDEIIEWMKRMNVIVIGPGLGRTPNILTTVTSIIDKCGELKKPLILDADALYLIANNRNVIKNYPLAILTPNNGEFERLFATFDLCKSREMLNELNGNLLVCRKGANDLIFDGTLSVECTIEGSGRRCGGQGDLLSGSMATFLAWALMSEIDQDVNVKMMIAAYAACRLTRTCNKLAFSKYGRSTTTSDMIEHIHCAFEQLFQQ